jgi:hypothetical protein
MTASPPFLKPRDHHRTPPVEPVAPAASQDRAGREPPRASRRWRLGADVASAVWVGGVRGGRRIRPAFAGQIGASRRGRAPARAGSGHGTPAAVFGRRREPVHGARRTRRLADCRRCVPAVQAHAAPHTDGRISAVDARRRRARPAKHEGLAGGGPASPSGGVWWRFRDSNPGPADSDSGQTL